ncbi:Os12g0135000, partial [Oryza sativa Japonica Group]
KKGECRVQSYCNKVVVTAYLIFLLQQLEVERSGTFIVPSNWRSGINMTKSPAEISTQR